MWCSSCIYFSEFYNISFQTCCTKFKEILEDIKQLLRQILEKLACCRVFGSNYFRNSKNFHSTFSQETFRKNPWKILSNFKAFSHMFWRYKTKSLEVLQKYFDKSSSSFYISKVYNIFNKLYIGNCTRNCMENNLGFLTEP